MDQRKFSLRFPDRQTEKNYQSYFFRRSLNHFRLAFLLVTLLYALFGFLDHMVISENTLTFYLIRFAIVIPFLLFILGFSYFSFFEKIWQYLLTLSFVVAGSGIILMVALLPENITYYAGLMLVFSAGYFFIKLRFFYATLAGWALIFIFNFITIFYSSISSDFLLSYNFFFIAQNFICMFAANNIEMSDRKNFLLNQKLNAQSQQLADHNKNLEMKVKNRTHELAREEKKYRQLVEEIADVLFSLNPDGRINYISPAIEQITGKKPEYYIGENISSIMDKESQHHFMSQIPQLKQHKQLTGDYKLQSNGKNKIWVNISLKTNDEDPLRFTYRGIMKNITESVEKHKLKEQIEVAQKTLVFKQNFLANMSHEIRTPLTGVIGMIEILRKSGLNEKQTEYIDILKQSGENLREIINQVLDFSKIEAGKMVLNKQPFVFEKLFQQTENLFGNLCHKKNLHLETHIDCTIPEIVGADQTRLTQIINNLVSNSVKFTFEGKIVVSAELMQSPHSKNKNLTIKISVSDTGIGIRPEKLKVLFTPFSQITHNDARSYDGTGLGLSICRELARLHGGETGAESTFGKGSTFWFTFETNPAVIPMQTLKEKERKKDILSVSQKSRKLNILLAEDKKVNQLVVSIMLADLGHKVSIANNGEEALEKIDHDNFDLILMDIQMPVMDGITATTILKQQRKNLPPIVGLSANAFEGDKEKYMQLGMDEYLTKPVTQKDFTNVIGKIFS